MVDGNGKTMIHQVHIQVTRDIVASIAPINKNMRTQAEAVAYEYALLTLAKCMPDFTQDELAAWEIAKQPRRACHPNPAPPEPSN